MKTRYRVLAIIGVVVVLSVMSSCKPPAYYLDQVYRVYGSVHKSDGSVPTTVEVSIKGYQYSSLTNYLGDYELMLPEGTWTIRYERWAYLTNYPIEVFKPSLETVTVGPANPKIKKDVVIQYKDWVGSWKIIDTDPSLEGELDLTAEDSVGCDRAHLAMNVRDRSTGTEVFSWYNEIYRDTGTELPATDPGMFFYSISDNQMTFSVPGFGNHIFVRR